MARLSERLSAKRVELAARPGMYADGHGLYCASALQAPSLGCYVIAITVSATTLASDHITSSRWQMLGNGPPNNGAYSAWKGEIHFWPDALNAIRHGCSQPRQ